MAQIEVVGNAGGDAELKYIKGSKGDFAIANLSLGETPRKFKDGEWVNEETVWWKVSATGSLAEWMADTPLKGIKLLVKGDLKAFEYTGRDGNVKQGFEIQAKMVAIVGTLKRKSQPEAKAQDNEWPF
jgi:single stranded DNA-binding protein